LRNNNFEINILKTKYTQFYNQRSNRPGNLAIQHNGQPIEQAKEVPFLGIMLDQHCTWKIHIQKICNTINRFSYALWRLVNITDVKTALLAYHGYVASDIRYGMVIWGDSVIGRVFIAQKQCIRSICQLLPMTSCKPYFK
jgi:hypothetical protein